MQTNVRLRASSAVASESPIEKKTGLSSNSPARKWDYFFAFDDALLVQELWKSLLGAGSNRRARLLPGSICVGCCRGPAEALCIPPPKSLHPYLLILGLTVDSRLDVAERAHSTSLEELAGRSSGVHADDFARFRVEHFGLHRGTASPGAGCAGERVDIRQRR